MSYAITPADAQSAEMPSEQQMLLFADFFHHMQMSTEIDTQNTANRILVDLRRSEAAQQDINNILGGRVSANEKGLLGLEGQLAASERLRVQEKLELAALKQLVQELVNKNASLSQKLMASEDARIAESQRVREQLAQLKESFRSEIALKDQAFSRDVQLIEQQIGNVKAVSTRIEESLQQLRAEVATHEAAKNQQCSDLSQQIADLKRELSSHATATNARIDSTSAYSQEVRSFTATGLNQVRTQHAELQNRINASLNAAANAHTTLSNSLRATSVEVQNMKASTTASFNSVNTQHNTLLRKVDTGLEDAKKERNNISTKVTSLGTSVSSLTTQHNALATELRAHRHLDGKDRWTTKPVQPKPRAKPAPIKKK